MSQPLPTTPESSPQNNEKELSFEELEQAVAEEVSVEKKE